MRSVSFAWHPATLSVVSLVIFASRASAQVDNSALECGSGATFYPRGDHWPAEPPLANNPVFYRVQKDGAPGISDGADLNAVDAAFATWMNVTCNGKPPNIQVERSGVYENRDRGDTWECSSGGECNETCTAGCNLQSVDNIIYFVTSGWSAIGDSQTVALTTNLYIQDTGYIITADMEFNAENFQWRAAGQGCTSSSTCYDVESVALHEAGHFLGFNHVMCTDAVMFPYGSGTETRTTLSQHEVQGLCTLYPPRSTSVDNRDTGEQCTTADQCEPDHICIKPLGAGDNSPWGWCAKPCTDSSDCGVGFFCVTADNGEKFCKPGPHETGGPATGGTGGSPVDPTTGVSLDMCAACTSGSQCASGLCVSDGSGQGICTIGCVDGTLPDGTDSGSACPDGMDCLPTDQGWSVCWPSSSGSCTQAEYRGMLNELCYLENNSATTSDDWFRSCGPDLICFAFKPRCAGREGRCVQYCNSTGTRCRDGNLRCCAGVDEDGNCIGVSPTNIHGGCFDLRRPGETCVHAEQSICEPGAGCFHFDDPQGTISRCFSLCGETGVCESGDACVLFSDACSNDFGLCCETEPWQSLERCLPSEGVEVYDVGVQCRVNDDCDSRLCLKYEGESACSRWCNAVTGVGCPGDIDVNGDGSNDGGFTCKLIEGEGRCWPIKGAVSPPGGEAGEETDGCCSAMAARPGDWLLGALLFAPLCLWRRRMRR